MELQLRGRIVPDGPIICAIADVEDVGTSGYTATDPAADPATDPASDAAADPAGDPAGDPPADSAPDPPADAAGDPPTDPAADAAGDRAADRAADAAGAAAVDAAVTAGARLVDLGSASLEAVTSARERHPGIFVCATGEGAEAADFTWDPAAAARTGAGLLCRSAQAALASRAGRHSVLIAAAPAQAAPLVADGWAVLVNADSAGPSAAAAIAAAAAGAWVGARVVRTRNVSAVRQALNMVESIRGTRPPARSVRGLA